MKAYFAALLLACAGPISTAPAQVRVRPPILEPKAVASAGEALPLGKTGASELVEAEMQALPVPNLRPVQCPPEALGAACGTVDVPSDREHPGAGTIPIYFELYRHSGGGRAESAILANFGGPGFTTAGWRSLALTLFGQSLIKRDLLLIDDRGRGLSGAIDCPQLQHGLGRFDDEVAACAAQLGSGASRYGTGDIAQDTEAVRAALGYDKVDYFGWSGGGADVTAYAVRYGEHLRSIVLDSPVGTPILRPFAAEQFLTHAKPRMVRLACQRSPACSADHPFPDLELNALIWTVRFHPVEGEASDASGNVSHVRVDEEALLDYVLWNDFPQAFAGRGNFVWAGEVLAAASALWQGDSKPLLRLAAEGFSPLESDSGDPRFFSRGANIATPCVDFSQAWSWLAAPSERLKQYEAAVATLPEGYFSPFSKSVATSLLTSPWGRPCLHWEVPTPSSPVAPPGAVYPRVPTLVLSGDQDARTPLELAEQVASLFPASRLVRVAESGHLTVLWTECGAKLVSRFIENLDPGDTSCARTPETVWPAVGRFPRLARFARAAEIDRTGLNSAGIDERRAATVAVAAVTDALQRANFFAGGGKGLRGGSFQADYGDGSKWTLTLTDCAFAEDVKVNGRVTWAPAGAIDAELDVAGPGTRGGHLHVEGTWQMPGPAGVLKVTGTLGGSRVAVLVPSA